MPKQDSHGLSTYGRTRDQTGAATPVGVAGAARTSRRKAWRKTIPLIPPGSSGWSGGCNRWRTLNGLYRIRKQSLAVEDSTTRLLSQALSLFPAVDRQHLAVDKPGQIRGEEHDSISYILCAA